ncbi:hypothetical protein [Clostridium novyi]
MIYGVNNSIFSLRELEYKIKQDIVFQKIIGLKEFSLRAIALEKYVYYDIYAMLIELINPSTRICAIDGTALRSSLYDSEARYGKGTRLGRYKGYKLHCTACVCDSILPLSFSILKGLYNLENPRLYGQKRYERHVKWVLLSHLIDEFNKVNSKISSRKYPWNL